MLKSIRSITFEEAAEIISVEKIDKAIEEGDIVDDLAFLVAYSLMFMLGILIFN